MSEPNAKAEDKGKPERPKKPPGYRKFAKLLRQVVKAPPLRKPAVYLGTPVIPDDEPKSNKK
jgi:hypothetical protein